MICLCFYQTKLYTLISMIYDSFKKRKENNIKNVTIKNQEEIYAFYDLRRERRTSNLMLSTI